MRLQKLICPAAFFFTAMVLFSGQRMTGQVLSPISTTQEFGHSSASSLSEQSNGEQSSKLGTKKTQKPYKVSSRFHLQKGTNSGYLVVKLDLEKGSYIYSLTQKAPLRPSKISVAPSQKFKLTGEFNPDRPATVIENDPVFEQRVEKHKGEIQFFASVEIAPGVDVETLIADVSFGGQVCTDAGFCMPIMGAKAQGKFAGYFERGTEKRESPQRAPANGIQFR